VAVLKHFLEPRPLVMLFGVSAVGYLVGQLRLRGFSLGVSAVLFAGLFAGWAAPGNDLPEFIPQLGLVLFVYTVGLASGPGFFASLRLRGLRDNGLALGVLLCGAGASLAAGRALHLSQAASAGLFAGSFTNMPALAAVVESLKAGGAAATTLAAAVFSCTVAYPIGVLVPLVAVALAERVFAVSYRGERVSRGYGTLSGAPIVNVTARVEREPAGTAHDLRLARDHVVVFSRLRRGAVTSIVRDDTRFRTGDLVTIIGAREDVLATAGVLGQISAEHLELDRRTITNRRIFVSNPQITERPLASLGLTEKYDAVITRVRRGDVDLTPDEGSS